MRPRSFEYVRPSTVTKAIGLLRKHGDRAKVLAGGQSLIPVMKLRLAAPEVLVDIGRIPGLDRIKEDTAALHIGALTRHGELESSRTLRSRYPLLSDTAAGLGDPEVRNMGTIGGSLAHADPAGDWGAALLALDARIVAKGPEGTRTIRVDDFFLGPFTTALAPAEILTEIRIPRARPRSGGAYAKLKRRTGDFATVGASAFVRLDSKGKVEVARIGLAAVGPTSIRAREAERALVGNAPSPTVVAEAAARASAECHPTADLRGSEAYKRAMVAVFVKRALESAVARAGR